MPFFLDSNLFHDGGLETDTSLDQKIVEKNLKDYYAKYLETLNLKDGDGKITQPTLQKGANSRACLHALTEGLKSDYANLDASRTWICYWNIHALRMMNVDIPSDVEHKIITFLNTCQAKEGGYGGGPGQLPHIATTYGAVMALVSLGTSEALRSINREGLLDFLLKMKKPNGSFALHVDGEADIRGVYCALAIAAITNIIYEKRSVTIKDTEGKEKVELVDLTTNVDLWLISCQSYEGGFGAEPSSEGHGGYTFCAIAALTILGQLNKVANEEALVKWLVARQMKYEGGFSGRSNKLVDNCYSFWVGCAIALMDEHLSRKLPNGGHTLLFDWKALQAYILIAGQCVETSLFRDKPKKVGDFYHNCYSMSGLSISQKYAPEGEENIGGADNQLERIHPVYNLVLNKEQGATTFFKGIPLTGASS
ncbi:hypothetical protein L596_011736 [Steinernema carpocapsae]|uniref:Protein farnesyltransferase subunit beta n=1 Tax=Steinernema carpocapsae TaxID=34508 RepID=A0A4U5NVA5_STECR|nr:hypothetical protein L596_011736 [Steinernema carpocapsae]